MRLEPSPPWTVEEKLAVALVSRGINYDEGALRMHVSPVRFSYLIRCAAKKLPGDLKPHLKVVFWSRGATKDQLTGQGWIPEHK